MQEFFVKNYNIFFLLLISLSINARTPKKIINKDPEITLLYNFVSDTESEELKKMAAGKMKRSCVGDSQVDERRTSSSAMFINGENLLIKTLEERAAKLVGFDSALVEIQVVHYLPGQQFAPHYDYLDDPLKQARGTQRIFTLLVYLNEIEPGEGGQTFFPKLNVKIRPKKNSAVLWRNILPNGNEDERTLHAGLPIESGEKWAVNIWLHEKI